jgi:hypothetical protein
MKQECRIATQEDVAHQAILRGVQDSTSQSPGVIDLPATGRLREEGDTGQETQQSLPDPAYMLYGSEVVNYIPQVPRRLANSSNSLTGFESVVGTSSSGYESAVVGTLSAQPAISTALFEGTPSVSTSDPRSPPVSSHHNHGRASLPGESFPGPSPAFSRFILNTVTPATRSQTNSSTTVRSIPLDLHIEADESHEQLIKKARAKISRNLVNYPNSNTPSEVSVRIDTKRERDGDSTRRLSPEKGKGKEKSDNLPTSAESSTSPSPGALPFRPKSSLPLKDRLSNLLEAKRDRDRRKGNNQPSSVAAMEGRRVDGVQVSAAPSESKFVDTGHGLIRRERLPLRKPSLEDLLIQELAGPWEPDGFFWQHWMHSPPKRDRDP